jgi:hypothetical protein
MIQKTFNRFATLNTQFLLNKSRNAVRFESQNLLWDYEESNYQSQVFAKGLASLSFKQSSLSQSSRRQHPSQIILKLTIGSIYSQTWDCCTRSESDFVSSQE